MSDAQDTVARLRAGYEWLVNGVPCKEGPGAADFKAAADEIERLRRELSYTKTDRDEFKEAFHGATQLARNYFDELLAAREDARRLDWLERTLFSAHWNGVVDSGSAYYWRLVGHWRHIVTAWKGEKLRAAIDAAIAAEASPAK
jgi:hypothetical protein